MPEKFDKLEESNKVTPSDSANICPVSSSVEEAYIPSTLLHLWNYKRSLVVSLVVGGLLGVVFTKILPNSYETVIPIDISKGGEPAIIDLQKVTKTFNLAMSKPQHSVVAMKKLHDHLPSLKDKFEQGGLSVESVAIEHTIDKKKRVEPFLSLSTEEDGRFLLIVRLPSEGFGKSLIPASLQSANSLVEQYNSDLWKNKKAVAQKEYGNLKKVSTDLKDEQRNELVTLHQVLMNNLVRAATIIGDVGMLLGMSKENMYINKLNNLLDRPSSFVLEGLSTILNEYISESTKLIALAKRNNLIDIKRSIELEAELAQILMATQEALSMSRPMILATEKMEKKIASAAEVSANPIKRSERWLPKLVVEDSVLRSIRKFERPRFSLVLNGLIGALFICFLTFLATLSLKFYQVEKSRRLGTQ